MAVSRPARDVWLDQLENLKQEYTDFVYRVSHDFSAPVRAVTEFSRLLRDDHASQLDEEGMLYLGLILQAGEKMRGMFEGLLSLSRLNTVPPCPEAVDLGALVRDIGVGYQQSQGSFEAGDMPVINADATHMRMLFQALLDNAFRFVEAGTKAKVQVSAIREDGFWRISVKDAGIGIAPEFHADIFTVFRRLHKDGVYPGLGLGLAVAKKIVDLYGGRIWVESTEGHGAAFSFTLPAA